MERLGAGRGVWGKAPRRRRKGDDRTTRHAASLRSSDKVPGLIEILFKQKEILRGRGEGAWDRVGGAKWSMWCDVEHAVWQRSWEHGGRAASPMH